MTCATLIKELAAELRDALEHVRLPTEYMRKPAPENFVAVNVFEGYLPENLFEQTSYYPCVAIELIKVVDDLKEHSTADLGLTIGTFSLEQDAWLDAVHLMELIRQRLLTRRVIGKKFRLKELSFETPSEQPREFFFIIGAATFEIFQPQELLSF